MLAANAGPDAPRIPDREIGLLELIGGADSVALTLSVPASDHRATIANLPFDPVESEPRPRPVLQPVPASVPAFTRSAARRDEVSASPAR